MAPRMPEEREDRTRSPHGSLRAVEAVELEEGYVAEEMDGEKSGEKDGEEPNNKKKHIKAEDKAVDAPSRGYRGYTEEEWAQWRREQEEWRNRAENNMARWETRHTEAVQQAQMHSMEQDAKLAAHESQLKAQDRAIHDLSFSTALLSQWAKEQQQELASTQIKLLGWNGESRGERKAVVERWITQFGLWRGYDTTRTLDNPVSKRPLTFSLMMCKTKEDRDDIFKVLMNNKMWGSRGTEIWGRKNMARYQRESGGLIRYIMRLVETVRPNTHYSWKDWPQEAVKIDDVWAAAAITSEDPKHRTIVINEALLDIKAVMDTHNYLWWQWGDYDKRVTSSAPSSSSALLAPQPRVFYLQDHMEVDIQLMSQSIIDTLDAVKEERDEAEELRRLEKGKSTKGGAGQAEPAAPSAPQQQQQPQAAQAPPPEEHWANNAAACEGVDGPPGGYLRDKRNLQPPPGQGTYVGDSSDDDEEMDLQPDNNYPPHCNTSAEHVAKAKQALLEHIQSGAASKPKPKPKGKSKAGTSADAVRQAKKAVWGDDYYEEDWSEEGYTDKKGKWRPYNSGAAQNQGKGKGKAEGADQFSNVSADYRVNNPWSEWRPISPNSMWGNGREWWEEGNYDPEEWGHHYPRSKRAW